MQITEVKIRKLLDTGRLRAVVSVTFDGVFAVHDIKVVQGEQRLFVAMPSRRENDGTFRDVVHPINAQFRQLTENAVLESYKNALAEKSS
ncbi:MAG: septation regulator SpoVG [Ruminococcus sp.]|nr:septation regulator SpoVG [Ruminococcus sp.]